MTLPGRIPPLGHLHPLSQVMDSLVAIFRSLGFVVADGPEMESEFHNFEALNVPADHPARDMQDTFYLATGPQQLALPHVDRGASHETALLRTHTSPVQVRIMQQYPPPIAVIVPGRVYRHEAQDATHAAVFHQLEGLLVDKEVSFADLKGTLTRFVRLFFGPETKMRFRPSFFPFTEPSAEMDVYFEQPGRSAGWIEIMGAGMVHPNVLRAVGLDAEQFSGFAFGMGIERLAMIKHGVDDLRLFQENDIRFLRQF
jgi:phenylalanyl-tRNA synthetase alpha chain